MAMYKIKRSHNPAKRRRPHRPRNPFAECPIITWVDGVPYIFGTLDWYPY